MHFGDPRIVLRRLLQVVIALDGADLSVLGGQGVEDRPGVGRETP